MEKTADLTLVQKTIANTLKKRVTHQRSLLEKLLHGEMMEGKMC